MKRSILKTLLCVSAFTSVTAHSAHSQELGAVLRQLKADSPTIALQRNQLIAAENAVKSAEYRYAPQVLLDAIYGRKNLIDKNHRDAGKHSGSTANIRDVTLSVKQNLFRGYEDAARIEEAELRLQYAQANFQATVNSALADAAVAYLEVMKYDKLHNLLLETLSLAKDQQRTVQRLFHIGKASENLIFSSDRQVRDVQSRIAANDKRLARYLGDYRRYFHDIATPENMSLPSIPSGLFPRSLEAGLADVVTGSKVLAGNLKGRSAQAKITQAESAYYPDIDLTLMHRRETDNIALFNDATITPEIRDTSLELRLRWDLTGAVLNKSKVLSARGKAAADLDRARIDRFREEGKFVNGWNYYQSGLDEVNYLTEMVDYEDKGIKLEIEQAGGDDKKLLRVFRTKIRAQRTRERLLSARYDLLKSQVNLLGLTGKIEQIF